MKQGDYVLRTVEERGVRFVRLWFVDVLGLLKSFSIPVSELEGALEEGVGIDGSSLEGNTRMSERDAVAELDPRSFQVLPWRPDSIAARMFCDVRLPDGTPHPGDTRQVLRRALSYAAELGYTLQVGPEIEFFLFQDPGEAAGEEPRPLDHGAYFDLTPQDVTTDFRRKIIDTLEQMGIPVKAAHHELGPSQHELDLTHTDALSMADAITTFRLVVKEVARETGVYATFMPKPLESAAGSGMHLHCSLFKEERNAFWSPDAGEPLSPTGRAFLAGVLAHAPELTAVSNQWVNSYTRLATGFEAPGHVGWTQHGNPALVRIPSNRPGKESAARLELRSPDPACNPYLVFSLLLAAGLRGIERGYQLPAEANGTIDGLARLPSDLREATDALEASELARDTFGEVIVEWFVRNKRREWEDYRRAVTDFDRARLLELL
ncbi:MAG: glutamine synthetase [Thermoleophilaceae bacterium]|nr:glutamine synthetase [Thermoleophilaceae bacterium]